MNWLSGIPDWVGTAIIGAAFASIGYFARELLNRRKKKNLALEENFSNFRYLSKLLTIQKKIWDKQCEHRKNLSNSIKESFPTEAGNFIGYEERFEGLYDKFSKKDRELHRIIRSQTESFRYLNKKILPFADKIDVDLLDIKSDEKKVLKEQLEQLVLHIIMWLDKYESWIPNNEKHALVYLADEKKHGVGFPKGIEEFVKSLLGEATTYKRCISCKTLNDLDAKYCKICGSRLKKSVV